MSLRIQLWVAGGAKDGHAFEVQHDFLEDLQPLSLCLRGGFEGYVGHLSAVMGKALNEPNLQRANDKKTVGTLAATFFAATPRVVPQTTDTGSSQNLPQTLR
jgi:hypothetical protein